MILLFSMRGLPELLCYLETYNQKTLGALSRVVDLCVRFSLHWKEVLSLTDCVV